MQNLRFDFPLEISIKNDKQSVLKTINVYKKFTSIAVRINFKPVEIILDPKVNLLFDGNIEKIVSCEKFLFNPTITGFNMFHLLHKDVIRSNKKNNENFSEDIAVTLRNKS